MRAFLSLVLFAALLCGPARAEQRIALVIGNGGYDRVSSLENPVADARAVAKALEPLGFDVTLVVDAGFVELSRAIAAFGQSLRAAGGDATGLFYYAGHGVQNFGTNYLLPVDVAISDPADLDFSAINAQAVLRQMASARNKTNIFLLDACRNNPFDSIPAFGENGLAEMKAPTGTFLAYATAPGEVAFDGTGGNSPFTAALTSHIGTAGSPIEEVFRNVRIDVLDATGGLQTPWDTSSLTSAFFFREAPVRSAEDIAAEQLWNGVRTTNDPVQVLLFLRSYPDSAFAEEARALLDRLIERELTPAAQAAPAPAEPSAREQELIGLAQASGDAADYQAYLDEFPNGVFAELARTETASLVKTDPVGTGSEDPPATPAPTQLAAAPAPDATRSVAFDSPLDSADPALTGRSIADLIAGTPLFPPLEGLPEELWKGQKCSNCHEWTAEALCTQAQTYLLSSGERSLALPHPYGSEFKQTLRSWAAGGCP